MQFIVYDFEIFKHDWLVVFKKGEKITVVHNDRNSLLLYYEENKNNVFVGFNNKHYDDYILKGLICDLEPKLISDFIVFKGHQGWEYPGLKNLKLNTLDIKQDLSRNQFLSLKEAEGNMGMDIEESEVDFDLDRPLNESELQDVIKYCKHDVMATEQILIRRQNDIKSRLEVLKMFDLPITHIGKTNAKLTAKILDARKRDWDDEMDYEFPKELDLKNEKIKDFYRHFDDYDERLNVDICGVEHQLGFGGLHGAKKGIFEGNIWYADVASYYPSMIIEYNYISRNLKDMSRYKELYNLRMKYKKEKDPRANVLKLVLNTTFGAMKNKYNELYDPKQPNQICISGQLLLIDLLEKLEPYSELIQSNTDGIIFISHNDEKVQSIIDEWQKRTRMGLEVDKIDKIWQKDVNNYIIKQGDKIKVKGGYVRDYSGGDFARNTTTIIDMAIVNYFVHNMPPEKTINECNDLIAFQYVVKKGSTYISVEHNGKVVNNCNRVLATKDTTQGKLVKVKSDGRKDSIANLPHNCAIVNSNLNDFPLDMLDKQWYIEQAYGRIQDFLE